MWGARGRREAQVPRAHKGPSAATKAQGTDGAPQMGTHGSAAGPKAGEAANKDQTPPRRGVDTQEPPQSTEKGNTKLSAEFQSLKQVSGRENHVDINFKPQK